jgi:hypothetical protein
MTVHDYLIDHCGAFRMERRSSSRARIPWIRSEITIPRSRREPMTRLRLTIAQLMTFIFFVGFGFAALRNANQLWASATFREAV